MKRILIIFTLIYTVLFISGCLEVEYHIKFNDDGRQNIIINVSLPVLVAQQSSEIIDAMKEEGFAVTTKSQGDKYIISAIKVCEKNMWYFPGPKNYIKNASFKPSYYNYLFFNIFTIEGSYLITSKKSNAQFNPYSNINVPMRYFIEVPGKIKSHNAMNMSGNTLQWEYNLNSKNEIVNIQFSSYTIKYFNTAIFIFLVTAALLTIFLLPQYKKPCIIFLVVLFLALPIAVYLMNNQVFAGKINSVQDSNQLGKTTSVNSPMSENQKDDPCQKVYELYLQCVENKNGTVNDFSRADMSTFNYYESVFDRTSFFGVCKKSIESKDKMDYSYFKTAVCTKQVIEAPIEGTPAKGTPVKNEEQIQTKFGTVTFQKVKKDNILQSFYIILPGKKVYEIKEPGDYPDLFENSFKVGDSNIFFITTGEGNAAEWSYMVIERSDGIFISDPNDTLPYISKEVSNLYIKDNKFIIVQPYQYGKDVIVTYDNGKLTRKGNFNFHNGSTRLDIKEIKLIRVY
jgi:hypothetical protein